MSVTETCQCGASIMLEGNGTFVMSAISKWRTEHQHIKGENK